MTPALTALLLALTATTSPTSTRELDVGRLEQWAHGAAQGLDWHFDLDEARRLSLESGRPLVVYQRELSGFTGLAAARGALALPEVSLDDDGYARDVLFRAAVLGDPCVSGLLTERFVLCSLTQGASAESSAIDTRIDAPGLIVYSAEGRELGRLESMGVLSADRVDAFLRSFVAGEGGPLAGRDLEALYRAGELELLLSISRFDVRGTARLWRSRSMARLGRLEEAGKELDGLGGVEVTAQRGRLACAQGEWERGAQAWREVRGVARGELWEEATFALGWCLSRLGRPGEARGLWLSMAGESELGRRAAACVLPAGPRLHLASSVRAWIEPRVSLIHPARSLRALVELQQGDGSFTATAGFEGAAWGAPAITALALEALRDWQAFVPVEEQTAVLLGAERARHFLVQWAGDPASPRGVRAFNEPRVLRALLGEGELDAARELVRSLRSSQLPAGGWSAYGDGWTVSFLTAEAVLAWLDARAAGLTIPESELSYALDALELLRGPEGSFVYSFGPGRAWLATPHGAIARDPLCELALLRGGRSTTARLEAALERYLAHVHELEPATRRLDVDCDERGHASYHFFYAHAGAVEAALHVDPALAMRVRSRALAEISAVQEVDGTYLDHWRLGRAYGTAMALRVARD